MLELSDREVSLYQCIFQGYFQKALINIRFPCKYFIEWKTINGKNVVMSQKHSKSSGSVVPFQEVLRFSTQLIYNKKKKIFLKKESCIHLNLTSNNRPDQVKLIGRVTIDLADIINNKSAYETVNSHKLNYCSVQGSLLFSMKVIKNTHLNKSISQLDKSSFHDLYSFKIPTHHSTKQTKNQQQSLQILKQNDNFLLVQKTIHSDEEEKTKQYKSNANIVLINERQNQNFTKNQENIVKNYLNEQEDEKNKRNKPKAYIKQSRQSQKNSQKKQLLLESISSSQKYVSLKEQKEKTNNEIKQKGQLIIQLKKKNDKIKQLEQDLQILTQKLQKQSQQKLQKQSQQKLQKQNKKQFTDVESADIKSIRLDLINQKKLRKQFEQKLKIIQNEKRSVSDINKLQQKLKYYQRVIEENNSSNVKVIQQKNIVKLNDLNQKIRILTQNCQKLKQQNSKLENEKQVIQSRLQKCQKQLSTLQISQSRLKRQIQTLKADYFSHLKQKQLELQYQTKKFILLEQSIVGQIKLKTEALNIQNINLKEKNKSLQSKIQMLSLAKPINQGVESFKTIKLTQYENKQKITRQNQYAIQINEKKKEISQLSIKILQLQNQNLSQKQIIQQLSSTIKSLENIRPSEYQNNLQQNKKENKSFVSSKKQAQISLLKIQSKNTQKYQKQINILTQKVKYLEQQNVKLESKLIQHQQQKSEKQKLIIMYKEDLIMQAERIKQLDERIKQLEQQILKCRDPSNIFASDQDKSGSQKSIKQKLFLPKEDKVSVLKSQLQKANQNLHFMAKDKEQLLKQNSNLSQKKRSLQQELLNYKEQNQKLTQQLQKFRLFTSNLSKKQKEQISFSLSQTKQQIKLQRNSSQKNAPNKISHHFQSQQKSEIIKQNQQAKQIQSNQIDQQHNENIDYVKGILLAQLDMYKKQNERLNQQITRLKINIKSPREQNQNLIVNEDQNINPFKEEQNIIAFNELSNFSQQLKKQSFKQPVNQDQNLSPKKTEKSFHESAQQFIKNIQDVQHMKKSKQLYQKQEPNFIEQVQPIRFSQKGVKLKGTQVPMLKKSTQSVWDMQSNYSMRRMSKFSSKQKSINSKHTQLMDDGNFRLMTLQDTNQSIQLKEKIKQVQKNLQKLQRQLKQAKGEIQKEKKQKQQKQLQLQKVWKQKEDLIFEMMFGKESAIKKPYENDQIQYQIKHTQQSEEDLKQKKQREKQKQRIQRQLRDQLQNNQGRLYIDYAELAQISQQSSQLQQTILRASNLEDTLKNTDPHLSDKASLQSPRLLSRTQHVKEGLLFLEQDNKRLRDQLNKKQGKIRQQDEFIHQLQVQLKQITQLKDKYEQKIIHYELNLKQKQEQIEKLRNQISELNNYQHDQELQIKQKQFSQKNELTLEDKQLQTSYHLQIKQNQIYVQIEPTKNAKFKSFNFINQIFDQVVLPIQKQAILPMDNKQKQIKYQNKEQKYQKIFYSDDSNQKKEKQLNKEKNKNKMVKQYSDKKQKIQIIQDVSVLQDKLKQQQQRFSQLQENYHSIIQQTECLVDQKISELQEKIAEYIQQAKQKDQLIKQLQLQAQQTYNLKYELAELKQENQQILLSIKDKQQHIQNLTQNINTLKKQLEKAQKISQNAQQTPKQSDDYKQLQINSLKQQINELKIENNELNLQINSLRQESVNLSQNYSKIKTENENLKKDYKKLNLDYSLIQNKLDVAYVQIDKVKSQLAVKTGFSRFDAELKLSKNSKDQPRQSTHSHELLIVSKGVKNQEEQKAQKDSDKSKKTQRNEDNKTKGYQKHFLHQSIDLRKIKNNNEGDDPEKRKLKLQRNISEVNIRCTELQKKSSLSNNHQTQQIKSVKQQPQNEDILLKKQISQQVSYIKLAQIKNQNNALREELITLNNQYNQLKKEYDHFKAQFAYIQSENSRLLQENKKNIPSQIKLETNQLVRLKQQLQSLTNKLKRLQIQNNQLKLKQGDIRSSKAFQMLHPQSSFSTQIRQTAKFSPGDLKSQTQKSSTIKKQLIQVQEDSQKIKDSEYRQSKSQVKQRNTLRIDQIEQKNEIQNLEEKNNEVKLQVQTFDQNKNDISYRSINQSKAQLLQDLFFRDQQIIQIRLQLQQRNSCIQKLKLLFKEYQQKKENQKQSFQTNQKIKQIENKYAKLIQQNKIQIQQKKKKLQQLNQNIRLLNNQLHSLREQNVNQTNKLQKISEELMLQSKKTKQQNQEQFQKYKIQNQRLKQKLSICQAQIQQLKATNKSKIQQNIKIIDQFNNYKVNFAQNQEKITLLNKAIQTIQQENQQIVKKQKNSAEQLISLRIKQFQQETQKIKQKYAQLQQKYRSQNMQNEGTVNKLRAVLQQKGQKIKQKDTKIEQLQQKISYLIKKVSDQQKKTIQLKTYRDKQIQNLIQENKMLNEKLSDKAKIILQRQTQILRSITQQNEAKIQVQSAKANLQKIKNKQKQIIQSLMSLERQSTNFVDQIKQKQSKFNQILIKYQQAEQQIGALRLQAQTLREDNDNKIRQLSLSQYKYNHLLLKDSLQHSTTNQAQSYTRLIKSNQELLIKNKQYLELLNRKSIINVTNQKQRNQIKSLQIQIQMLKAQLVQQQNNYKKNIQSMHNENQQVKKLHSENQKQLAESIGILNNLNLFKQQSKGISTLQKIIYDKNLEIQNLKKKINIMTVQLSKNLQNQIQKTELQVREQGYIEMVGSLKKQMKKIQNQLNFKQGSQLSIQSSQTSINEDKQLKIKKYMSDLMNIIQQIGRICKIRCQSGNQKQLVKTLFQKNKRLQDELKQLQSERTMNGQISLKQSKNLNQCLKKQIIQKLKIQILKLEVGKQQKEYILKIVKQIQCSEIQ